MTETPLISVIIPSYNSSYIEACLQSCLDQAGPVKMEILVVDDASTDDTPERVRKLGEGQPIQLIKLASNQGPAAARNAGLEKARGEFIAFLDSDDLMAKERLKTQMTYLQEHPEIEAVISGIEEIDGDGKVMRQLIRPFPKDKPGQIETIFLDELHTVTSTLFFKRSLVESVGMMDAELKNLEDMEFVLKLLTRTPLHYIERCLTVRRVLSSGLSQSVSQYLFLDSRKQFYAKAVALHPELGRLEDRYWSLNHKRLGRILQRRGEGQAARKYHALSLRAQVNLVAAMGLVLSLFPSSLQQTLANRNWKNH